MSYTGKRKYGEDWYHGIPPKDVEEGKYIKNIDYGCVAIKVTERGRVSYYHRDNDRGDYELIPYEDCGSESATALSEREAETIKFRLKKEHPTAEIVPYPKK